MRRTERHRQPGSGAVGGSRGRAIAALRELLDDAAAFARDRAAYERNQRRRMLADRLDIAALGPVLAGRLVLRIDLLPTFYDCAEDFAIDDIRLRPKGADVKIEFPGEPGNTVKAACYQQHPTFSFNGTMEPYYINPAYQWQVSMDSGASWTDIPGATSPVLTQTYTVRLGTLLK